MSGTDKYTSILEYRINYDGILHLSNCEFVKFIFLASTFLGLVSLASEFSNKDHMVWIDGAGPPPIKSNYEFGKIMSQ